MDKTCSTGYRSEPSSVVLVDWNQDNPYDIIVANEGVSTILIFKFDNNTCILTQSYGLNYRSGPRSIAIGNVNNDQMLDITVANYQGNSVEVLLQTCEYDLE